VDNEVQRRIAANEAALREVNEAIERGLWPGEKDGPVEFRCECARLGCDRLIILTIREYEQVRAHPRRFVIAPGHQASGAEEIVESRPGYWVIEKDDQAGVVAEASDPRE
jgi:hypothetical protein